MAIYGQGESADGLCPLCKLPLTTDGKDTWCAGFTLTRLPPLSFGVFYRGLIAQEGEWRFTLKSFSESYDAEEYTFRLLERFHRLQGGQIEPVI